MPTAEGAQQPDSGPTRTLVTGRQTVRRPLGSLYLSAFLVVPLLLTALIGVTQRGGVEDVLELSGRDALADKRVKGVDLVVEGRTMTAEVPSGRRVGPVRKALADIDGVAELRVEQVYASKAEARACADLQRKVDRATDRQRIGFVGETARLTATGQQMVQEVARLLDACGLAVVTVGGHTDARTSDAPTVSLQRARAIIGILRRAGIEADRMRPRGYADQFPLADGDSPAAQATNQRGSIRVERS
jgi:outer membrane protein OmpA-like peptidoglycan-associated protein